MSRITNMGVGTLLLFVAALLGVPGAASGQNGNGVEKQVLCHVPPGNPDNPRTIEVGAPAVQAHLDHGDSIGACEAEQAVVSGGVFDFATQQPVAGAAVTLTFVASGFQATTQSDENGLFVFEGVPVGGAFFVEATDGTAVGSAEGSVSAGDLEASVVVTIDEPGPGSLVGTVFDAGGQPVGKALVTYLFPETQRTGSTITTADGSYAFTGLQLDGTVLVIAFDPASAASASDNAILVASFPNAFVNLTLPPPPPVQPELVNGDFNDGLAGWQSFGPTFIVPREDAFQDQSSAVESTKGLTGVLKQDGCPVMQSAVISSAGSSNGVGQLSQSFTVPPAFGTLEGRVKFLSNEWPEFFGTQFNDTFLARLTTPSGAKVLASGNVNSSSWSGGILGFNGQTPEINFSIDISPWVGKTVNLHFEVRDVVDLIFDSGLAISDVRLIRTEQYVSAGGGLLTGSGSITGQFGQGVRITFNNENILGTTVRVRDKTPFGETKESIILPLSSVTFTFARFGEEPMFWDFDISTISDAFVVTYEVESTWVEGMPPNPCF